MRLAFRQFGLLVVSILTLGVQHASAQDAASYYIQIVQLTIDPAHLDAYRAAVSAQIDAAVREEPGVLSLQAVADKNDPTKITVFEVYASEQAYRAHLQALHFKTYKATVEPMVTSLTLIPVSPVEMQSKLGTTSNHGGNP